MPGASQSNPLSQTINPARSKPRSRAEIDAEISRVDEAIDELTLDRKRIAVANLIIAGDGPLSFRSLGAVSVPVALRALRHYRQRLSRKA